MTNVRNALVVAVGLTFFMTVLPPAIIGGADGAVWKFIETYQTLITGLAAVAAATATIRQMARTDERAQLRHEELIRDGRSKDEQVERRHTELVQLQLRADTLRIDRMLFPHYEELRARCASLDDVGRRLELDLDYLSLAQWKMELHQVVQSAFDQLSSPDFVAARDLWSGPLVTNVRESEIALHKLRVRATEIQNKFDSQAWEAVVEEGVDGFLEKVARQGSRKAFEKSVEAFRDEHRWALHLMNNVFVSLDDLASTYKIVMY